MDRRNPSAVRARRLCPIALALGVLLAGLAASGAAWWSADPLPREEEVQTMTAWVEELRRAFPVPPGHRGAILDALRPTVREPWPAQWRILGRLEITRRDGGQVFVQLYYTPEGPGAFAAGPTFQKRTSYRGGDTAALLRALRAAQAASYQSPGS